MAGEIVSWIIWWTGAGCWATVAYLIADRLIRTLIFAYRIGWKVSRRLGFARWVRWIDNPPDAVGGVYYPSKSGASMRREDLEC